MSHPIFATLATKYHDRVQVTPDGLSANLDVSDNGAKQVPVITEADRKAMGLPSAKHRDRRDPRRPGWYPPVP